MRAMGDIKISASTCIDTKMENFEQKHWRDLVKALRDGYLLQGTATILRHTETGELFLDADSFEITDYSRPGR